MVQPATLIIKGASQGTAGPELEQNLHHEDKASEPQAKPRPGSVREIGGPTGPEPTRYGDWERKGRCIDF